MAKSRYSIILFSVTLVVYITLGLMWVFAEREVYYTILKSWGTSPFQWPFVDIHAVFSAIECHAQGIDVYVRNPCDILGRPHVYSPLWLRLTFLGVTTAITTPAGILLDILFFLCVAYMARPEDYCNLFICMVALFSTMVIYAVERANNDLVIFVLVTLAGALFLNRGPSRYVSYATMALAGFLKFYPFCLFVTTASERPVRFLTLNTFFLIALVWFIVSYCNELRAVFAIIPAGDYFSEFFGSKNLPFGIIMLHPGLEHILGLGPSILLALCDVMAVMAAMAIATWLSRSGMRLNTAKRDGIYCLMGCALLTGCFFTGQSVGYRGIYFLFVVPWLLNRRADCTVDSVRKVLTVILALILFIMWGEFVRRTATGAVGHFPIGRRVGKWILEAFWLLRECSHWAVITFFLSLTTVFLLHSPIWTTLYGRRAKLAPRTAGDSAP